MRKHGQAQRFMLQNCPTTRPVQVSIGIWQGRVALPLQQRQLSKLPSGTSDSP